MTRPGADNFWRQVAIDPDGCWEWIGRRRNISGYGRVKVKQVEHAAHRYSWMIHNGPIPDGLHVCHRCDNRLCVRPDHLWLGTQAENNADMRAKGRAATGLRNGAYTHPERLARGSRNGASKLTAGDVFAIRQRHANGESQLSLAREFGVVHRAIWAIVHNETWLLQGSEPDRV